MSSPFSAVALPGRQWSPGDDARAVWPPPAGGAGGTIANPSREAAAIGDALPGGPSRIPAATSGQWGIIPAVVAYDPAVDRFSPGTFYGSSREPMPRAWFAMHYVRHFVSSGALSILRMGIARPWFNWTTNRQTDDGAPASPIPVASRFLAQTFAEPYGEGRIWAPYLPREAIQAPVGVRRALARRRLPRMGDPYFPRLTRVMPPTPSTSTTITPQPLPAGSPSPFATVGVPLSRFSRSLTNAP